MQINEFKVSLIGPPNLGKSLFLRRLVNNSNNVSYQEYKPTLGVDVVVLELNGNLGKIRLNIWDCSGDSRYRGLKEQYHIDTKAAIIFRKSTDDLYLEFKNELPGNVVSEYIIDYNLNNPEKSISEYKDLLYNFIINISY